MRQYRYVVAASDGTSYDFARHDKFEDACYDLTELLADGWKPVRETPMGQAAPPTDGEPRACALVLVLLEKKFAEPKQSSKKGEGKKQQAE
jgi:hypothetical protein